MTSPHVATLATALATAATQNVNAAANVIAQASARKPCCLQACTARSLRSFHAGGLQQPTSSPEVNEPSTILTLLWQLSSVVSQDMSKKSKKEGALNKFYS